MQLLTQLLSKIQSPYLSALDFCNSSVWNVKFDELDFFPSLNWIFLPAVACKNQARQIWYFKLKNYKNKVQIDRGSGLFLPHI